MRADPPMVMCIADEFWFLKQILGNLKFDLGHFALKKGLIIKMF